jgi:2-phosphosulfolactate phosphatase
MTPFAQEYAACRCEWGTEGLSALAPADVTIIVDVFTFTTCVDVALGAGAIILPYRWEDPTAADYAVRNGAELAGKRRQARYSLAPESYVDAPAGLRCVLPSPNGARITLDAAARSDVLLAACLRNAEAVATTAERLGRTINVIACGERWPSGALRPALEDALGAGAVLAHLAGRRSVEAKAFVTLFEHHKAELRELLAQTSSGRELEARGHVRDTDYAAALNASAIAPRFDGVAYVAA